MHFILFTNENSQNVISLLGLKELNLKLDNTDANDLCLFCNGPWCDQTPAPLRLLLK